MRVGWQIKRLKEVCTIRPPKREAVERLKPEDKVSFVPMECLGILSKDLKLQEERKLKDVQGSYTYFADNDVLLAKITPCFENGKLGIARNLVHGVGFGSSEYVVLRSKGEIAPEFLFYFLSQDKFRADGARVMTGAVGHKRIPKEYVEDHKIPLPPLEEQKRIVGILDEAFEGIEKAQVNAEKNLANARELFISKLNSAFLQKSEEWPTVRLGSVCKLLNGRAYKKPELLPEGKYPVLRVGNFFSNRSWYYSDLELDEDKYCDTGDLLYAWSASFGPKIWDGGKVIYHYHIWKTSLDEEKIDKKYLYYWFDWDTEHIKSEQGTGTTMIHVTKGAMEDRQLVLPPLAIQQHLSSELDNLQEHSDRLAAIYEQKLKDLAELKQSLLQKAFSGELTKAPSTSNVIPFPQLSPDEAHIGTIAYGYRKHEGTDHFNTYLRTKSEKIVHLIEYQTGIDMGRTALQMARGPYDPDARERVEITAKASNYFETYDNGHGIAVRRLANFDEIAKQAEAFYGAKKAEVDRIIELFLPLNHEDAEVRATVYTAWNNLLIDGEDITDEKIVTAAREDWENPKTHIPRPKFFNAIRWLEKNNLVPQGQGKRVGDKRLL